jgi:hypothetical protein
MQSSFTGTVRLAEFGGHPDTAASRMRWVRQLTQTGGGR